MSHLSTRSALGLLLASTCLFAPRAASAQFFPNDQPTRLPALGRSAVSDDDSTALVVNPANLAFLPGTELRWTGMFLNESAAAAYQGHAFAFAFPIPFLSLSTGLRLDIVSPPRATSEVMFGNDNSRYEWLTWGLAFKPSDAFGLGFSLQRSYSNQASAHDLASWSLGFTSRPSDYFGFAVVGQNLNAPTTDQGGFVDRTYNFAVAIRPARSRAVEVGLESEYVSHGDGYWVPRATLGVDVPQLGRLRGDFAYSDPGNEAGEKQWLASASFAFNFNGSSGSAEVAGGTMFGNALGEAKNQAQDNLGFEVAARAFRDSAAAEAPRYALSLRIEDTPNTRAHTALLRRLWDIADNEPTVAAVVLELRTAPADSMAHTQELRDAVFHLRQAGKRVLCHLEDADGSSLYLCSAADRILLNPAGGIRFAGLKSRYMYFASLLDKLGIHADFVRIGAHKSAPESFMRDGSTETSRADKIDLLQQIERNFTIGVATGRHIDAQELRARIAKGPFVASEAKFAGLVDGFAFDDQLEDETSKLVGYPVLLHDDRRAPRTPDYFGDNPGIALVYVDGDMVDGRSQTIPLLGTRLVGSYTIAESLKKARENPKIGAVVLRVETGGGSAMAADVIYREVQLTAAVKPVIVSMGSAAASGGYYISAPGSYVFANPSTITGSIGIFYGKADVAELLKRIGVTVEVYKTAPRADAESIFRPFSPEERTELERKVAQFYDVFLTRVATGRKLSKPEVDAVGQGRVWTGEQALDRKLVDEIGGLRQALALARKLGHVSEHGPIVELPPPDTTLIGRILGIEGVHEEAPPAAGLLPAQLLDLVRALSPFMSITGDKPFALMEMTPVGP
ncbi:MAG TPA: signal peptide peptidase SppA [Polyangiaceae bacterium]|jgi:protease-4|nr:signal peptide peptidase SppA [Polyangiaceae bacterium]